MFGFEHKFDWDSVFIFVWSLSKNEGIMVNEVLDLHLNGMEPGIADIVIKFEDSFQRMRFWEVFVNRVHVVYLWVGRSVVNGDHCKVNGINEW